MTRESSAAGPLGAFAGHAFGQGPDDGDVEGDDEHRPQWVVGDEQEVVEHHEADDDDAHDARPGGTGEQSGTDQDDKDAEEQVDPAPGGGVELEGVVDGVDVELVVDDGDEAL